MVLLLSFLGINAGNVYIVTPDDYSYTNETCHNLRYYLRNAPKYFTSNTQLLFLPGIHHLTYEIIIQEINNISLIGNGTVLISVIPWNMGIKVINSSMIIIKNFAFANGLSILDLTFLYFKSSHFISLHNIIINATITAHNVMGESVLSNVTSHGIDISYDDSISVESLNVHKFMIYGHTIKEGYCNITMAQHFYGVSIIITDCIIKNLYKSVTVFITDSCVTYHENKNIFDTIQFIGSNLFDYIFHIHFSLHNLSSETCRNYRVQINNCYFVNNVVYGIISSAWLDKLNNIEQNIIIKECIFANNIISENILSFYAHHTQSEANIGLFIIGGKFLFNCIGSPGIKIHSRSVGGTSIIKSNIRLQIIGPSEVHGNEFNVMIMGSVIMFHNYIEFSQNKGSYMIYGFHVLLIQPVMLNINENDVSALFSQKVKEIRNHIIPFCYFQFYGNKTHMTNETLEILITDSHFFRNFGMHEANINCRMSPESLSYEQNPLVAYQRFIHYQNETGQYLFHFSIGSLCYCSDYETHNCYINTLGPIFPGQTLTTGLCLDCMNDDYDSIKSVPISTDMYSRYLTDTHCKVLLSNQILKWITRNCTQFHFTILSNNEQQCELFLNAKDYNYITIFYVKLLKCPMGFSFDISTERCECDVLMNSKLLTIRDCNINNQSVLRPANSLDIC